MPLKIIPSVNQYSQGQGEVCFVHPTISASTSCFYSQLCAEARGRPVRVSPYNKTATNLRPTALELSVSRDASGALMRDDFTERTTHEMRFSIYESIRTTV